MGERRDRIDETLERQHGVITARQVAELDGDRNLCFRNVRSGRWRRYARGVYLLVGAPSTNRQRLAAGVFASGPIAGAGHVTAAALHGIPGFTISSPVDVSIPDHQRTTKLPGVRQRRSSWMVDHHLTVVDGIPTTTVARTLFDLAASQHPKRAERALDNALGGGMVTVDQCERVLNDIARSGRNGTVRFRRFVFERSEGFAFGASELERRLFDVLRASGLPLPEPQVATGTVGRPLGITDYWYRAYGIPIEADSRRHHTALLDWDHDLDRDNERIAEGSRPPLRFTWRAVTQHPQRVTALVEQALRSAGWRPPDDLS